MSHHASISVPASRWRWLLWPGSVFMLLGSQVIMSVTALVLALSAGSLAVEPDYYQQAVAWDQSQAEQRASAALGWELQLSVEALPEDPLRRRRLSLALQEAAGQSVTGAQVAVGYFHHARGDDRREATLEEVAPGVYAARLVMPQPGLWEFRIQAEHPQGRFVQRIERTLRWEAAR